MKNLNKRQKALYKWLIKVSEACPGHYWSKEIICNNDELIEFYPRWKENTTEHNSTIFNILRKDIRTINLSEVEKIIVSNHEGYKIATKEEAEKYIKTRLKTSLKSLKLYWTIKRKMEQNGQIDIDLNQIETFIGGSHGSQR